MTEEELYTLLDSRDAFKEMDVKTLVIDIIRSSYTEDELTKIFLERLPSLDEETIQGYRYRKF